jgi:hypothetical protein
MIFNRRTAAAGLGLLGLIGLALPSTAGHREAADGKRPVVVELYTSQGCSSCPPADALLGQLSTRKDVLALSLPITYWDMLGWKDTLASENNTRRQKAYARVLGRGGVYTPQMIVDGLTDVIGSREPAVAAAIGARAADGQSVPVDLLASHQELHIAVGSAPDQSDHDATIWLFRVLPQASVRIGNGENGGRTVVYRNVVRDIKAVGMWKGQAVTLDLPRSEVGAGRDGVAVVVQQGGYGRIVGAASIDWPDFYYIR